MDHFWQENEEVVNFFDKISPVIAGTSLQEKKGLLDIEVKYVASLFKKHARYPLFLLIFTFLWSGLVSSTGRADLPVKFPSYAQFAQESAHWHYRCDIQEFFADPTFRQAMGVNEVPSDSTFNERLANTLPHILYQSIMRLRRLNPEYAAQLFRNVPHLKLRFICTSMLARDGTEALTRPKYFLFGAPTINLGGLVLALVQKKFGGDDRFVSYAFKETEEQKTMRLRNFLAEVFSSHDLAQKARLSEMEAQEFKTALFHEFLHADTLQSKFLFHAANTLKTGGQDDVVYSCADYAWAKPLSSPRTIRVTSVKQLKEKIRPYESESYSLDLYSDYYGFRQKKELKKAPLRALLNVFTYQQCLTCALARPYANTIHKASDSWSINLAKRTCSQIAPKIKASFSHA